MSENNKDEGGLGLGVILFLIFLVLKLGGWGVVATWSWWAVFSPLWIPLIIVSVIIILFIFFHNK